MAPASPLVLVGPMGAGKTSIGRRVAKALGVTFIDTDAVVQREHGPIEQIFEIQGESTFRSWERAAIQDALGRGGAVVSLGGGAVLDADTRADLATCDVVMLTVDPRVVAGRIQGTARPLLSGEDPLERWRRIWQERRPLYESVADITIDTSTGPLQHVVDEIVSWARHRTESSDPLATGKEES
ncbi:shikimate kinase [Microbacterium sp.]|uniref:shikimate kinase n=1 Tax=unclassified Microbacterium TaxID=2609290 RepID=UPI00262F5990|nr:shikimate kinase [Microbacterium sp.]